MEFLNIENNFIQDCTILTHLTNLKEFRASNNIIASLKVFVKVDSIVICDLSNNRIESFEEIGYMASISELKYLNIESNPITIKPQFNKIIRNILKNV